MKVKLHPHAQARILERGATEREVIATVENGEQFPVRFGRWGFRRNGVASTTSASRLKQLRCKRTIIGWLSPLW